MSFLQQHKRILKNGQYFPTKQKKCGKKNCGRPTDHNYGHPLDRKQKVFLGGLAGVATEDYGCICNSELNGFHKSCRLYYNMMYTRILLFFHRLKSKNLHDLCKVADIQGHREEFFRGGGVLNENSKKGSFCIDLFPNTL